MATIDRLDFDRLTNNQIRKFIYQNKLAIVFWKETGRHVRQSSRSEIAAFLKQLTGIYK